MKTQIELNRADTARQYRSKYPDYPTLKLARIMYEQEKLLFKDVENARSTLRYIEGKRGKLFKSEDKKAYIVPNRPYNPYKIPESDEEKYEPFILQHKKVAIINDLHVPYHDIDAISCAIDKAVKEGCDAWFINGDLIDMHTLSRFVRNPKAKNFAQELQMAADTIKILKNALNAPVYLKLGNHEERYEMFLKTKATELAGVEDFDLNNLLKKRCDVTVIGDKRIVKIGKLICLHGHEGGKSIMSPVNIARGLFLKGKASAICGHHHRTSEHTEQTFNGDIITTFSVGALCGLNPQYLPIGNNWNHGMAICETNGEEFHVRNYRIYKGKIL